MRYLEHKTEVGVLRNPLIKRRYLRPCIIFAVVALLAFFNFVAIYKLTERRDIGGNEGCSFATPPTSQQFNSDDPLPKLETDWRQTTGMKYFDIGVPCQGQDKKLVDFATVLGDSIREYLRRSGHNNTEFRLIVTRYKSDDSSRSFRHELADKTSLDLENIIFASTEEPDFHRAFAINLLHEKTRKTADSVLAIVDVDLNVGPRFLFNSLTKVSKNSTYFPIVFSQFRPSNVLLVEKFLGPLPRYSEHRGIWRDFGYGMYSISGLDAKEILMNETFVGWGGEDNDFFGRVNKTKQMIVIREKEYDLVHIWHPKYCVKGLFLIKSDWVKTCIDSRDVMEGSKFGLFLLHLKRAQPSHFETLLQCSSHGQTGLGDVLALAKIEYTAGLEPKITGLKPKIRTRARKPSLGDVLALAKTEYTTGLRIEPKIRTRARKQSYSKPKDKILIAVTASRKKFGSRVAEAVSTWANERNLPSDITLKYFVGDLEKSLPYKSGSDEDIRNLAKEAGIIDLSSIVVMNGVDDNEHPLVGKAVAVIKHMRTIDKSYNKTNGTPEYDWFFDIDDDTYVNFAGLQRFVLMKNPNTFHYLGQRGEGAFEDREMLRQNGLKKPYCMGGPGILMSRQLLRLLEANIDNCLQQVQISQTNITIFDDVLFGICVQRETGLGCWEKQNYREEIFANNFLGEDDFLDDSQLKLSVSVSLHPHKTPGMMKRLHERFKMIST